MEEIKLMGFGEPDKNGEQRAKSQNSNSPPADKLNKMPSQSDVKKRTIDISIEPANSNQASHIKQANARIKQANARIKQANAHTKQANAHTTQVNPQRNQVNPQRNQVNPQRNQVNPQRNQVNPQRNQVDTKQSPPDIRRDPANANQNTTSTRKKREPTRDEIRQTNGRIHKRRRKKNYILYYILLSFLLAVVLVSLSLTVLFNLSEITVKDYPGVNKEQIIASSAIKIGDNLVRMNTKKIEAKILKENIMLDSVSVKRKFPSNVEISLVLSEPKFGIKNGSEYHYFSEKGRFFSSDSQRNGLIFQGVDVSKIELGEYLSKALVDEQETMKALSKAIIDSGIPDITYVDMRDISAIKIYYKDEIEIKIGSISFAQFKIEKAWGIISTSMEKGSIGQLDVQLDGKCFFRPLEFVTPW